MLLVTLPVCLCLTILPARLPRLTHVATVASFGELIPYYIYMGRCRVGILLSSGPVVSQADADDDLHVEGEGYDAVYEVDDWNVEDNWSYVGAADN